MTTSQTSKKHSIVNSSIQLSARDVSVSFGTDEVLHNISFDVYAGEFVGLVGQNGSGKTTLLRVLLGLLKPTKGEAIHSGVTIGYVPQRGQLYNGIVPISVIEVVRLGSKGDTIKAHQALKSVGMQKFLKRDFNELSGGQQQRVVIAKALASGANVLVLDEPTTGVDKESQAEFYTLLKQLRDEGRTIIMVSHDIDSVVKIVSRVICLNHTIMYDGLPEVFDLDLHLRSNHTAHLGHEDSRA